MESVSYPYPLIPTPPGDWQKSLHEMQAIRMAALHNIIIRSFNAIIYHAPNVTEADVPSFIKFCRAVADVVHEHHQTEEEVMFPYFEEKLGKGAMDANVSQHHDFMPHFDQWNEHCKKILAKEEEEYRYTLGAVDEIPTLEVSWVDSIRHESTLTDAELRELETRIAKKIQECISVWILPILFVSGDLSYNSWFPDEAFEALRHKARDATPFVSAVASCEVLEETPKYIKRKVALKTGLEMIEEIDLYAPIAGNVQIEHGGIHHKPHLRKC
ncbi:hypothetical protein RhiXN_07213 [Rhizoctonia solani]|uniref:Hemerythrin-like domain-containing protein n=1 Tax=Rhizoctonia solani TaxID=456999 RepID=A0A8H8P4A8_9AGAM|nr:uncharacterized protein RhiXN_07213 [Rhizoctonia solani]QRW25264.1 hypothetical protein RhiXN_07213 [Rhizoctonia solani]